MIHFLFIPIVITTALMGIGLPSQAQYLNDVNILKVSWFYNWSTEFIGIEGFVPMSFNGDDPRLNPNYNGYLLVFNEPENSNQTFLSPDIAAVKTLTLAKIYPNAKLIVGGTGYFGRVWLNEYINLLGDYRPTGLHVHGYVEGNISIEMIIEYWTWVRSLGIGEFWITEFSETNGNMEVAKRLINWCKQFSTRYAWFANRLSGNEWYYPKYWKQNPSLLIGDNLTDYGTLYLSDIK